MANTSAEELERALVVLQATADALPYSMFWKDMSLRYYGCNVLFAAQAGLATPAEICGRDDFDMPWPRAQAEKFRADDREVLTTGVAKPTILEVLRVDGEDRWVETHKAPLRDRTGALLGVVGWFHDVTARKLAEEETARAHQEALQELATPLLPVADGVVVMPLVGTLDAHRGAQATQTLLAGVAEHRAHTAILDVTGVRTIDTHVIEGIVRAARGVRLLGAEAVITGIRPPVAQVIAGLGIDLGAIVALADLKAGVAHALQARRG
ncbi:rsbT co-antagonist protein RsbR [Nannocystis exedens]|uniref:RsbT co-antagonist protein RsbR n=1 Tax=Nannocystis exedens TaxID=54 RepID=A0A1I1WMV0_9BACT|nr:PAS domain-containing protein [Nannocystis exedens]PCC67712.1 anti-anti-sigma factor [Nannocystis exedens]SFD94410.1 rsbT co-antagonist protein RsbR [Nannocystis exedens]